MNTVDVFHRYELNDITGCWLWLGYTNSDGYARHSGHNAHRLFYLEAGGKIPDGWEVDHLCKRRNCVNPAHMEAVPKIVNNRRRFGYITIDGEEYRLCKKGHLIRGNNAYTYGSTRRITICWLCRNGEPALARGTKYKRRTLAEQDARV